MSGAMGADGGDILAPDSPRPGLDPNATPGAPDPNAPPPATDPGSLSGRGVAPEPTGDGGGTAPVAIPGPFGGSREGTPAEAAAAEIARLKQDPKWIEAASNRQHPEHKAAWARIQELHELKGEAPDPEVQQQNDENHTPISDQGVFSDMMVNVSLNGHMDRTEAALGLQELTGPMAALGLTRLEAREVIKAYQDLPQNALGFEKLQSDEAHEAAYNQIIGAWGERAEENRALYQRAIQRVDPEGKHAKFLIAAGLGSHPVIINNIVRAARRNGW